MNWYKKNEGRLFVSLFLLRQELLGSIQNDFSAILRGILGSIILVITPTETDYPTSLKMEVFSFIFSIAMHDIKRKQQN